jgi:hypothetical protein
MSSATQVHKDHTSVERRINLVEIYQAMDQIMHVICALLQSFKRFCLRLQCCLLLLSLQSRSNPLLLLIVKSRSYFLNLKRSSNPSLFHGGRANASNLLKSPTLDNIRHYFNISLSWLATLRFSVNLFHAILKKEIK